MPGERTPTVVGVDVGGTKVAAAAVAGTETSARVEHPTDRSSQEAVLAGIAAAVEAVAEVAGPLDAAGIGIPSQVDAATGEVLGSVNIPLTGVALADELSSRLGGVPVTVENDGNCAALAEAQAVDGGPARHLIMLTLGTGVGGGVVLEGEIFRGATGLGAELGHLVVEADGPPCPGNCPNRGCLEALCSGQALERDATALGRERPDSALGRAFARDGRVSGREAVAAADDGDRAALELFDRLGRSLGVGLASLVNVFEPEHLVLGGGLAGASHLFLEAAREEAGARALPAGWSRARLGLARWGGDAGLVGAGLLATRRLDRDAWQTQAP